HFFDQRLPQISESREILAIRLATPRRGADMVVNHAAIRDITEIAFASQAQAKIHVLVAVAIRLVESPEPQEELAREQPARAADRREAAELDARRRHAVHPEMLRHAFRGK